MKTSIQTLTAKGGRDARITQCRVDRDYLIDCTEGGIHQQRMRADNYDEALEAALRWTGPVVPATPAPLTLAALQTVPRVSKLSPGLPAPVQPSLFD